MENSINNNNYCFSSEDDNDKERVMHSKTDNIKIMVRDEANEFITKNIDSLKNNFKKLCVDKFSK